MNTILPVPVEPGISRWGSGVRSAARFFFKEEDGIRDYKVTGVQTCALPISIHVAARAGALTLGREKRFGGILIVNRGVDFAVANHRGVIRDQVARVILVTAGERAIFGDSREMRELPIIIEPRDPRRASGHRRGLRFAARDERIPKRARKKVRRD